MVRSSQTPKSLKDGATDAGKSKVASSAGKKAKAKAKAKGQPAMAGSTTGNGDVDARERKRQRNLANHAKAALSDDRFAHVVNDKRFKPIKKRNQTVKIEERFESMFTSEEFSHGPEGANELRRFYHTEADEAEDAARRASAEGPADDDQGPDGSDVVAHPTPVDISDSRFAIDYSRGEVLLESSSDESDDDESESEGGIDVWLAGQPDQHERVTETEDVGKRLAICNLDWAHVTAADLFVLANSFKPDTGTIESVTIYPSDFGLERMREEATEGPGRLIREATGKPMDALEDDSQLDEETAQQHLRAYELSKLRYYYAVVVCDSASTAAAIYEEIDGLEFEKSQNILDVRCVPDDVTFDNEPKDQCNELPAQIEFELDNVQQSALAHSKVKMTWDEDEEATKRLVLKKRKFTDEELQRIDYSNYLASSSEDESNSDGENETPAQDKRELLRGLVAECAEQEAAENPADGELEITWSVGLKERTEALLAAREERERDKFMTVGEKLEKKRREKKRARKLKLKEMLAGRGKKDDEEDDEMNEHRVGGDDAYFQHAMSSDDEDVGVHHGDRADNVDNNDGDREDHVGEAVLSRGDDSDADDDADPRAGTALLDDDDSRHFDMTKIIKGHRVANKKGKAGKLAKKKDKKKQKGGKAMEEYTKDSFQIDTSDNRFAAVFNDKDFSIDPTRPEFKKTREMERLIAERQAKIAAGGTRGNEDDAGGSARTDTANTTGSELGHLVHKLRRSQSSKKSRKLQQ
eukprot:m.62989 g.62989  ORF g.62989 m.62989 type:complete len:755 (-) comp8124_c0_seq1:27-2291(-)